MVLSYSVEHQAEFGKANVAGMSTSWTPGAVTVKASGIVCGPPLAVKFKDRLREPAA